MFCDVQVTECCRFLVFIGRISYFVWLTCGNPSAIVDKIHLFTMDSKSQERVRGML